MMSNSSPFFKITKRPADYVKSNKNAIGVVSEKPWKRSVLKIGKVSVTGRNGWGASTPLWRNEVVYYNTKAKTLRSVLQRVVIHHTNNNSGIKQNETKQTGKGYAALGYHFFIDPKGKVYEGRPLEVMGSHAGRGKTAGPLADPDWGSIGVVLQGDFHRGWAILNGGGPLTDTLTSAALTSLRNLLDSLRTVYGVKQLLMHREVIRAGKSTVCPGNLLAPEIEKIRKQMKFSGP